MQIFDTKEETRFSSDVWFQVWESFISNWTDLIRIKNNLLKFSLNFLNVIKVPLGWTL